MLCKMKFIEALAMNFGIKMATRERQLESKPPIPTTNSLTSTFWITLSRDRTILDQLYQSHSLLEAGALIKVHIT